MSVWIFFLITLPNIEIARNKFVETCMLSKQLSVFARPCRRSSPSTSCSSRGHGAPLVSVRKPQSCFMSSAASSLQAFPACSSQHPAVHEKFFAHEAFLKHPGILIDGHRNTSCDKTLRSRTWLHDMIGFMAPSISWSCMTCGNHIRTNNLETHPKKKNKQPARRDGTCSSA